MLPKNVYQMFITLRSFLCFVYLSYVLLIYNDTSTRREREMKSQNGFTLIEVVVGLALMAIISVAFLGALATTSKVLFVADERETAKNLAETQMEHVRQQGYTGSYAAAPIPNEYAGYSAAITAGNITSRDGNIQKVTVTIQHHGEPVTTLEGYKVNG